MIHASEDINQAISMSSGQLCHNMYLLQAVFENKTSGQDKAKYFEDSNINKNDL